MGGKQYLLGLYDTAGQVRFIFLPLVGGPEHVKDTLWPSASPLVLVGAATLSPCLQHAHGLRTKLQQVMALLPESAVPRTVMVVKGLQ